MSCEIPQRTHRDLLERLLQVTVTHRKVLASLEDAEQPAFNPAGHQESTAQHDSTQVEPYMPAAADVHEILEALAEEHAVLSAALRAAGLSADPSILPLAEKAWQEVQEVILALEAHRSRNAQALAARKKQKRRTAAYVMGSLSL